MEEKDPAINLFLHVDKKVDETKAGIGLIRETEIELKQMLTRLENRVDNGVSRTGQENKQALAEQALKINDLAHDLKGFEKEMRSSFIELATAVKSVGGRTDLIYKSIVGIFFVVLLGGFIGFVFKELPTWFK